MPNLNYMKQDSSIEINFLDYSVCLLKPARFVNSAWMEHVPFGMFLIDFIKPKLVAELGTYRGVSYCSFCQAVRTLNLDTKCYAIDSWEGDIHGGFYSQDVLTELRSYHDPLYGDFSTLVQSTFDEAVNFFEEKSIDLLHIDGLHTYEAVKHDFETWLPKLSEQAVVIFHDTNVMENDFGVWKFWDEITGYYPHFEFFHGHGLGVLGVGKSVPENMKLLFASDKTKVSQIRNFFFTLGYRLTSEQSLLSFQMELVQGKQRIEALEAQLEAQVQQVAALHEQKGVVEQQLAALTAQQKEGQHLIVSLQEQVAKREHIAEELQVRLEEEEQNAAIIRKQSERLDDEFAHLKDYLNQREEILQNLNSTLLEIYSSTAWKLIRLMWTIRLLLAPKESRRESILHSLSDLFHKKRNSPIEEQVTESGVTVISPSPENKALDQQHWVVMATPHTLFVAHLISNRLQKHGCKVEITTKVPGDFGQDYYVVICPQMFTALPPGEKRIVFQMEQSVSSRWFNEEYFKILEQSLIVLDYSLANIEFLANHGITYPHVYYLPIGASSNFAKQSDRTEKKYDVLFYGDYKSSPRRRKFLDALRQEFNVEIASEVFGIEMLDIIRRSRVVINLHYYENALLEMPRIQECLSLGVPVVSEAACDQDNYPELTGAVRFFEQGSVSDMIQTIKEVLENPISSNKVQETVQQSVERFDFMFDRFLVGMGFLSESFLREMCVPSVSTQVLLSLPETIARRKTILPALPQGFMLFDGIRKSPGWVGCGLSYATVARKALEAGIHHLTIIEDDALLPDDFQDKMSIINEYLDQHEGEWDIFAGVIASLHPDVQVLNVEVYKGVRFVTINKMISMVCNIYNDKALRILASWDPAGYDPLTNTIDRYLENQTELRVVVTIPFLVGHREEETSTIWGFQNTQYNNMILESQQELMAKVWKFEVDGVPT